MGAKETGCNKFSTLFIILFFFKVIQHCYIHIIQVVLVMKRLHTGHMSNIGCHKDSSLPLR